MVVEDIGNRQEVSVEGGAPYQIRSGGSYYFNNQTEKEVVGDWAFGLLTIVEYNETTGTRIRRFIR